MHDLVPFAVATLLVAVALLVAIGSNRLAGWIRVPAPALFLIAAAAAADAVPKWGGLSIVADQRIVTVALVIILFHGGAHIGWMRMRTAAGAVAWLGVAGTVITAGALALGAHALFGFPWRTALVIGTALAPTDPAVVFSVLGGREIAGRSGTLLEGESGANDPVGIALMVSVLGATGGGWSALGSGVGEFAVQLAVGTAFGVAGGWLLPRLRRSVGEPALVSIACALLLYGAATALHGSGFLAVFIAGILVGDREPQEVEHFTGLLAGLGEIVAFVVLGLSVSLSAVVDHVWTGLGLAALLVLLVRPLLVGALLLPVRLAWGERAFVAFAGLKGAVPILLGTYVVAEGTARAGEVYDIVFVAVFVSVLVQGSLVPVLARLCRVSMGGPARGSAP
jgi:cell volume regulation protein A